MEYPSPLETIKSDEHNPSPIEIIKKTITETRQRTEQEYEVHKKVHAESPEQVVWPACFMTDVHTMFLVCHILAEQNRFRKDDFERIAECINVLTKDVQRMYFSYRGIDNVPAEAIREQLFLRFESIGEQILTCVKKELPA